MKISTDVVYGRSARHKIRWRIPVATLAASLIVMVIVPRVFLRSELERIGPTEKLRFLRAMERSEYRSAGQRSIRIEDQTLTVIWDLRWNAFPQSKQKEIVRIIGRAWMIVGGQDTWIGIEGEDRAVASYRDGTVNLE